MPTALRGHDVQLLLASRLSMPTPSHVSGAMPTALRGHGLDRCVPFRCLHVHEKPWVCHPVRVRAHVCHSAAHMPTQSRGHGTRRGLTLAGISTLHAHAKPCIGCHAHGFAWAWFCQ